LLFPVHAATLFVWAISLASIACMLIRPRRIEEAYWVCGGALLLVLAGLMPLKLAAQAAARGWDVYLFLAGMMILAELARVEHVFDWAAGEAADHAKGSPVRLLLLVYGVGCAVTVFLSNDATAVVLTPAVLAVVRRLRVQPIPYLLACALTANAASFFLPISNPANLVVFDGHLPTLSHWLAIFLLPSVAAIVVTGVILALYSRRKLAGHIQRVPCKTPLTPEGSLALVALLVSAAVLVACSAFGTPLGAPTCGVAMLALAVIRIRNRNTPLRVLRGVTWSVLPLVAGLFVIVEALHTAGLLKLGLWGLASLSAVPGWSAKLLASSAVALLSNAMNNLPVGLMCASTISHAHESGILAHAMLIGVDLGPNLSVTGSLATILWLIALRRENVEVSAWQFFRVGIMAMPLALGASLLLLWH
jgi:arsenical pump membrane protein